MTGTDSGTAETIRKYAIKNAMDYGKASEGPVMSKVMQALARLKPDTKALAAQVRSAVSEVNSMSAAELSAEYGRYEGEFAEAEAKKAERSAKHNFSIEGASSGSFVTRFPPEPGGYMHIGHAKPLFVEDELRRLYGGKLLLYFDDTNPDNERQEFVDAFKEDFRWLGIAFDKEYYASDNIPTLYGYAGEAVRSGRAYVCMCSSEAMSAGRMAGKGCEHKAHCPEENTGLWERMLGGEFADNAAILRLNGDMSATNTTMRDPTLFRIKRVRHYRQGDRFIVWPTYDFCTPIVDSVNGITDVIRSKEYEMRDELYFEVLDLLGLRKPRITSLSRLEISGNLTSKRGIRQLIGDGAVSGWDDPRLVTISALRRRGIRPEAIREFSLSFGMGRSESVVGIGRLLEYNRKIVGANAQRLFMMEDMVGVDVSGAPVTVRLPVQGTAPGAREYEIGGKVFIPRSEASSLAAGSVVRLRDAFSIKINEVGPRLTAEKTDLQTRPGRAVRWLSVGNYVQCRIGIIGDLMSGGSFSKDSINVRVSQVESYASSLEQGAIVQFEDSGLFRLDDKKAMYFISL